MDSTNLHIGFKELCVSLTGVSHISERHLQSMLSRFIRFYGSKKIENLVDDFLKHEETAFKQQQSFVVAQQLIYCLYTGELLDKQKRDADLIIEPIEDYFESLLWSVVQAHPKGISGGYYGHWRYPPEDMLDEKS